MEKVIKLRKLVEELYLSKNPNADEWISWGDPYHVLVVADNAEKIANVQGADASLCIAGALLHDIADAMTKRSDESHEEKSLMVAKNLLTKAGFSEAEIENIITEVILPHSCRDILPVTLEGKVLATADAMAHFQTDFYLYFSRQWPHFKGEAGTYEAFKSWSLKKIEKDFSKKIFFEEYKKEVEESFNILRMFLKSK
jgi:putative nucleotidyltransferase with HDIG domain